MKGLKQVFIIASTCAVTALSSAVYTSCTKDVCKVTHCQNKGNCSSGMCTCKPGSFGTYCEKAANKLYAGDYYGNSDGTPTGNGNDLRLRFKGNDDTTNYTRMTVEYQNGPTAFGPLNVIVDTILGSGAKIKVVDTMIGGTYYSGNGTVSELSASLSVRKVDTAAGSVPVYYTFSNFSRSY